MGRNRTRQLWLQIKFDAPGVSRREVIKTLLQSVHRGDYNYPQKWRVALGWSNRENDMLRWGEFTQEMKASRESSPGFDMTVIQYLENM